MVAGTLAPVLEVDGATVYGADCLDVLRSLPDNSVDSIVTDPPYGLGNTTPAQVTETLTRWLGGDREFIPEGRGFMGRPWDAFVPPVAVWDECLRVLKPGGHALVFAGSRTVDLMTLALRLAGFDIRDGIMWLNGNGFPKSKDVSEAMAAYLEGDTVEAGPSPELLAVTGYLREARDAAGWTNRQIDELFGTNGMAGHWTTRGSQPACPSLRQWEELKRVLGFGDEMDETVRALASTERPEDWGQDGGQRGPFLGTLHKDRDYDSRNGWGTALKPSYEPVVVARKPVVGSITANVRAYGTGGLHVEACRNERGSWPANIALDPLQAAALDRQAPAEAPAAFFPVFRYEAKAPAHERPRVDGVSHPTVKPLELMRWLCRLVTPPGGTVLEPFAGSGTTVEAALLERFECIAAERSPEYLPLIEARLTKPLETVMDFGGLF